MSEGGTTRYNETGCGASTRSAMRQSDREVTAATVGSRYSPRKDMAVESTPERSFSLLLRSSRAAEATTGWTMGASALTRWLVVIIRRRVATNGRCGSYKKVATRESVFSSSEKRRGRIAPHSREGLVFSTWRG